MKKLRSTIARFDPIENSWTKLGNLKVARDRHGVIQVDNEFIVVGGRKEYKPGDNPNLNSMYALAMDEPRFVFRSTYYYVPTESCKLSGQAMTCTTRKPVLTSFADYPELMLIP